MKKAETIDLTNCDREKINLITYIQGHGAFAAVSARDMKIHHASENLPAYFGHDDSVRHFVGGSLNRIIGVELFYKIQERLRSGSVGPLKQTLLSTTSDAEIDVFLFHLYDDIYGVEFEKLQNSVNSQIPSEEILNSFIQKMHESETLEAISTQACRAVRQLTGLDRVMIYKFYPPTMYGQVIAEDKVASAHSFMSHRFPATDIPKPARDLYFRNHVRFIFDSHQENTDIFPKIDAHKGEPLDMSDSRLRGVSHIHTEYLKNMGVRSSLSIAIIIHNQLWGIISCHGTTPKNVSHSARAMCETIANTLALGASMFEKMSEKNQELEFFNKLHNIFGKLKNSTDPLDQMFREGNEVLSLFNCNGMVLVSESKMDFFGLTPMSEDLKKLWAWIIARMDDEGKNVICTESISETRPEFAAIKEQVSGILAIRLSELSDKVLIMMRSEFLETIFWGGDPRKNIDARNYNGVINPRESFSTWTEVIKNNSIPWSKHETEGIEYFRNLIFDSIIHKDQLLSELSSQLKNRS